MSIPRSPQEDGILDCLIRHGLMDECTMQEEIDKAKIDGLALISYLVKTKHISSERIVQALSASFGLPIYDLNQFDPTLIQQALIAPELIARYRILPLAKVENNLLIGLSDPSDHAAIDIIRFNTGLKISTALIREDLLENLIRNHCPFTMHSQLALASDTTQQQTDSLKNTEIKEDEPVIRFVDQLIQDAYIKAVSDIHIEPFAMHCRIRFRRDGILYEVTEIPHHLYIRLITRLKIMAQLDIAEKRLPQDGRIRIPQNLQIDIRISICATLFGEKVVLRLLDAAKMLLDINSLGLLEYQKKILIKKITEPQGLILVTGPTGSGKTLTLYSALHYLNTKEKNIQTVEDPIEIQLPGINQVAINPRIGFDFAMVLRAFLRQDPDIIMLGEVRDGETAKIAFQAAETGHLILSTLHTNGALQAIFRLQSMGIATDTLAHALTLIIAQRLVRKLCAHCKIKKEDDINNDILYKAQGCAYCHQGYQGRIGIFELIAMTENLSQLLLQGSTQATLMQEAYKEGFITLKQAGLEKIASGITTATEINRILGV